MEKNVRSKKSLAGARVLVVEDDPVMRDILMRRFSREGAKIRIAETAAKGKKEVFSFKPSIVLLDLLLPEGDGFMVLEAIKSNPDTESIPVIILSNLTQTKEVSKGLSLGALLYLIKTNVTPTQIVEEVKKILSL